LSDSPDDLRIKARAEILDNEGNVLARSTGEFVALQEEKLSSVPEDMKKEMSELFEKFPPV
jgi:acyl-CoA thioesterase FadM